uniref:Uncharacterized protein n=1 Tax=viral metagenome TaxID=1070528 RepID=A0A6C0AJT7_9ZZZZ
MAKLPMKWLLIGLLVLIVAGFVSFQAPGVQCPGSMIYCPNVGCVSGPEKCTPGYTGGPSAVFSKTWEKEQFVNGKDVYPETPKFKIGTDPVISACSNNTHARDGRCPEFIGP